MVKFSYLTSVLPWVAWGLLSACSQQQLKQEDPPVATTAARPAPVIVDIRELETQPESPSSTDVTEQAEEPESPGVKQPDDLWARMFSLYHLPPIHHPRVERELRWYAAHPEYIQRVQSRARPYLYTIVSEIEKSAVPGELALLPVVESAFKPDAYSHQRAAGLWQFIPSTGRLYGLKQNWWVDLRRDVHASTRAAITYLKKLNAEFDGDWLLALAAYNSGAGTVRRAIRRNHRLHRPTDFWHLRLPRETRAYVPKLLAVAHLFAHAREYGIALDPIPNRPLYAQVEIDSQLYLTLAAKLADMPLEELYRLNPGFRRWATAPEGPHRLVLPLEKVELFESRLAELPDSQRIRWHRHMVRHGDTLGALARRYGTPVSVIRQANHLHGNRIYLGQALMIPMAQEKRQFQLALARLRGLESGPGKQVVHVVRRGDTLWKISRLYGVKISQVKRWNGLRSGHTLRPGQRLRIRTVAWGRVSNPFRPVVYTVRKGDSLYRIAHRFGIRTKDLRQWNRDRLKGTSLQPGQRLKVYVKQVSS